MTILLKLCAIGIAAVIIISLIKVYKPEFVVEVTLCASIILLYFVLDALSYGITYFLELYNGLTYGKTYFPIIIKILAIAYVTEFAVALCMDAGEKSIASKIELAGKVAIFVAAIPVFDSLLSLLNNLV